MPGNMSEIRPLLVIVCFIGLFVFLVAAMYSDPNTSALMAGTNQGTSPVGDSGNGVNPEMVFSWNYSVATISPSTETYSLPIGGWTIDLVYNAQTWDVNTPLGPNLEIHSFDRNALNIMTGFEDFIWYLNSVKVSNHSDTSGDLIFHAPTDYLLVSALDKNWKTSANNGGLTYELRNSKTKFTMTIGFDTNHFARPSDALKVGGLYATVDQDFSDRNTSINLIGVISQLFVGSLPGMDVWTSFIVLLPIRVASLYLTFIFALKILGAIFGGG